MKIRAAVGWKEIGDFKYKLPNGWIRSSLVYQKDNGVWKVAHRNEIIEEFQIRVGTFNAPQLWYGFFKEGSPDPGTVSPTYYRGSEIRDFNASEDYPLRFQFGLYNYGDSTKVKAVEVGSLGRLPFVSSNQGSNVITRRMFSNGTSNVFQYLKSQLGKTITIKLIHDPV